MGGVELAYNWLSNDKYNSPWVHPNQVQAKRSFRRECGHWLNCSGIVGFGIGLKEIHGRPTPTPALQVFVTRKLARARLNQPLIPATLRLPHSSEVVFVDVVQQAAGMTMANRYAGDGIRQNDITIGPGSIGLFVHPKSNSNRRYAISCWHVAANGRIGGTAVDWCEDPEGLLPNEPFGQLDRYLSPARSDRTGRVRDIALIRLLDDLDLTNTNRAGIELTGVRTTPLRSYETLRLYGFGSKQLNHGSVINPRAVVDINYPGIGAVTFRDAIKTTSISTHGDSGSVAIDSDGKGVGVLVGGDSSIEKTWSLLVPMQEILDHFNVKLLGQTLSHRTEVSATPSDVDILARTLWGEAEGEPLLGKVAVANVVMNRIASGNSRRWGKNICGVCQKNNGRVWQFSCWDPQDSRKSKMESVTTQSSSFRDCLDIASKAANNKLDDVTEGATHFHARHLEPYWSAGIEPSLVIGQHLFFNTVS